MRRTPVLRWRFSQIEPDSFLWTGEIWDPDQADWILHQRIEARKARADDFGTSGTHGGGTT